MVRKNWSNARWMMLASVASVGAMCVSPSAAWAQDEDADDGAIIVTAQMREQNVQDIPLAITAISGEMLEARNQTNIADISAQVPSVLLQQNPPGRGHSMRAYIRGVGQWQATPSLEPGVGIYIDDIYFGTVTASAFDLVDLDRVEVLRGPQGTLAGMNSMGGAVKLYSRKPEGDGGFVELTAGNLGRRDIKASADFTLVPEAVYARITGISMNRNGHVKQLDYACVHPNDPGVISGGLPRLVTGTDCKVGELADKDMYAMRGALRIAPAGSPLEINLIGDYTNDQSNTQASVLLASAEVSGRQNSSVAYQGVPFDNRFVPYGKYRGDTVINDPYVTYANFFDPGYVYYAVDSTGLGGTPGDPIGPVTFSPAKANEAWGISGSIDYEINDNLALKSITGYREYRSNATHDNDNSPIVFLMGTESFEHQQFSQELRLSGSFAAETVHVTLGATYYDASTVHWIHNHSPFVGYGQPDRPTYSYISDDTSALESYAGFANVSWNFSEGLTLEGGVRLTHEHKDYTYGRLNPNGVGDYLPISNPDNTLTGEVGSWSGTTADFRAALSYEITPDVMAYGQFATGHKAGGVGAFPQHYRQIRGFGPEKLRSYEVGFKTDLADRRIRLNGAAFYMDYLGYVGQPQVCIDESGNPLPLEEGGIPGLCGQFLNLADATIKGFELEAFLRPVDGLLIDASLSLTDFKFGEPYLPTLSVVKGSDQPGIGEWKWSVGAQYEFLIGSFGTLTPRVDVNYTPGYCGDLACSETGIVDDYILTNARVTFETYNRDWQVSLQATNLFNKIHYLNKFANVWYATGQIGRPREVAISVRRSF